MPSWRSLLLDFLLFECVSLQLQLGLSVFSILPASVQSLCSSVQRMSSLAILALFCSSLGSDVFHILSAFRFPSSSFLLCPLLIRQFLFASLPFLPLIGGCAFPFHSRALHLSGRPSRNHFCVSDKCLQMPGPSSR